MARCVARSRDRPLRIISRRGTKGLTADKKTAPEGAVGEWDRLGSTLESAVHLDVVIDQQSRLTIGVDVVHLVADGLLLG